MKKTRRTKVTIETERFLVVGHLRRQVEVWCDACRAEVKMVGIEEAAVIAGVSQRTMFRRLEDRIDVDRLHLMETPRGALRICLNSLLKQTSEGE